MLEAELFVVAEEMTVEVLGRVRPGDEAIELPALLVPPLAVPPADPRTIGRAAQEHAADDAVVPAVVAGGWAPVRVAEAAGAGTGPGTATGDGDSSRRACTAVAQLEDGDRVVPTPYGELPLRDYLLRATVARSLLAHYVAAYLGSTACPLPEELARPLWELTAPDADAWQGLGWFFPAMPLPPHVSWRDRFLLTAGHQPHPLGH